MTVLIVDTALNACTVVVADRERLLAVRSEPMGRGHQEALAGFARDAMTDAGLGFSDLRHVAVAVGPGSFTGLRVGLAFAKGLGLALNRPVTGFSTLAALAEDAMDAAGPVAAVIDARRDQVYVQLFADGEPLASPDAMSAATAVDLLSPFDVRALVGSGAPLLASLMPDAAMIERAAPSPEALARLVARLAGKGATMPADPLYLRPPDATPPRLALGQLLGQTPAP